MNKLQLSMMRVPYDFYPATSSHVMRVTGYTNARVTRAYLQELCLEGYLNRLRMKMVSSLGAGASIYYGTRKGRELLASEFGEQYLHACIQTPNWQHAPHWLGCTDIKIIFRQSEAIQTQVKICPWLQEWDTVNPHDPPEKHARMYTEFAGGKILCKPDSGFALRSGPHAKGFVIEYDRQTTALSAICAGKNPGYMELARTKGHLRFFPGAADTFSILSVSLKPGRRDLLRKAMKTWLDGQAEKCRKEANAAKALSFVSAMKLWKFAAMSELTPETALHGAIWYPVEGDAAPLVKTPVAANAGDGGGPQSGPVVHPPRTLVRT